MLYNVFMENLFTNLLSKVCGNRSKFSHLLLLILSFSTYAHESYVCENTLTKNGVLDAFSKDQAIQKPPGQVVDWLTIDSGEHKQFLAKGHWYWQENDQIYKIKLSKLIGNLPIKFPSVLLRYDHRNIENLQVSPILQDSKNSFYPKAQIELLNPQLPVHRTWRLPKGYRAITNANYYIEYSERYFFPTRVIYKLKSAFIQNVLSCKKIFKKTKRLVLDSKSAIDRTNSPENWPKELDLLKESIHLLLVKSYLKGESTYKQLQSYHSFTKGLNLYKVLKSKEINKHLLTKTEKIKKLQELKNIRKTRKSKLTYISKIDESTQEILAQIKIENSPLSNDKNSFNIEDYADKKIIEDVILTQDKSDKTISFNFHSSKFEKLIKVGPINIVDLYWKQSKKKLSSCSMNVLKHLSEYERKSFLFKRSESENVNLSNLLYERKHFNYPLDTFILTNNCRGTGNFEFEWPGIVKSNFHVPLKVMQNLIDLKDAHTEDRMTKFYSNGKIMSDGNMSMKDYAVSVWSYFFEKEYQWKSLGDFQKVSNSCSSKTIEDDLTKSELKFSNAQFKYDMGRIMYDQFPVETRRKSGYNNMKTPLVYVKTPCNDKEAEQAPPKHFYPPKPFYETKSLDYWKKKTCSFVPINYFHYKDLITYEVHLSTFDVDGVYTGNNRQSAPTKTTDFDQALLKNDKVRPLYNFTNVYSFKEVKIARTEDSKKLFIKLLGSETNLTIGNISIEDLYNISTSKKFESDFRPWATDNVKGIYKLIGIRPFDLSNDFVDSPQSEHDTYSFFYDDNDKVLNHHDRNIGIEQWFLRYHDGKITLDLISHERITPVARIEIDYKL